MLCEYTLQTGRQGFYNVTARVCEAVEACGVTDGACLVYCPHATAGITVNENSDPDVVSDMLLGLERAYPDRPEFRHAEGNSAAHLRASAVGPGVLLPVENGRPVLGVWQAVYFCEFDGPRTRRFYVKLL